MIQAVFTSHTLTGFVSDAESFGSVIDGYFRILDADNDGILTPPDVRRGLNRIVAVESEVAPKEEIDDVYAAIFERFGETFGGKEFKDLMSEILTAMARAFGSSPTVMILHEDGLIMKAIHHESTKKSGN